MAKVIRLGGQPFGGDSVPVDVTSIGALRLITGMDAEEFSDALSTLVGWRVPLLVYVRWEQPGGETPGAEVLAAAREVSARHPIGRGGRGRSRREFLGGAVGLTALAAAGVSLGSTHASALAFGGGAGGRWRLSPQTAEDLMALVEGYRRAYAGRSASPDLLPTAEGLMHLLVDVGKQGQWPGTDADLASLIGQMALLAGLLRLMGQRDLDGARARYNLALRAASEAEDWDLASYALGSLAFEAHSAQRSGDVRAIRDATWELASRQARPRTRAWAAALSSELFAHEGDETNSRVRLDEGFAAVGEIRREPSWSGVGWFDEARLIAYEGGNLVLLGEYSEAEGALRTALRQLPPDRLKHRCTLSADLASAMVHQGEVEESCALAIKALDLASAISHRESIDRVRRVHFQLLRWRSHPSVQDLTARLRVA